MPVDLQWAKRNLPEGVAIEALDASPEPPDDTEIRREIIDFDSEAPGAAPFRTAAVGVESTGLETFTDIPWPIGLAPEPIAPAQGTGLNLPRGDVLIVTWTVEEGHALSRVLTPGTDSSDWRDYTKNYDELSKRMRIGCPAREYGRLGKYWTARIGGRSVTLFKCDSHMSQDGSDLVNADVWRQIIADVSPRLVVTTGTGGGIGTVEEVGDVVISRMVAFDCQRQFKALDGQRFVCKRHPSLHYLARARSLFRFNQNRLPPDNTRATTTFTAQHWSQDVLTTDFFGFDTSDNHYGLQGKGALSEMGDAVLGMVCGAMEIPPTWVAVRNVSDPQISADGLTLGQQADLAGKIYKAYGRWSSVCSAIVCWALAADA
jgi:Phosphorylase superfamily